MKKKSKKKKQKKRKKMEMVVAKEMGDMKREVLRRGRRRESQ